ncbi:MAG: hypothetical protein LBQ24_05750 [Candidatus Peribacteria bacterium]|nr:hypothetical protein [Candidatus Peribacteria bacterium]
MSIITQTVWTFSSFVFSSHSLFQDFSISSKSSFNFFVLYHLLVQYFFNQSNGCPDMENPIISCS